MMYRVLVILLVLAGLYAVFEIVRFQTLYARAGNPEAAFQVQEPEDAQAALSFVIFVDYNCNGCKKTYEAVLKLMALRKDIRYVMRPVIILEEGPSAKLTRLALAAGLQGKFQEMHNAFLTHPDEVDDAFVRETAGLYGLDYDKMVADSQGEEVDRLVDDNQKAAIRSGVTSVPTLFIGRSILEYMREIPTIQDLVRYVNEAQK